MTPNWISQLIEPMNEQPQPPKIWETFEFPETTTNPPLRPLDRGTEITVEIFQLFVQLPTSERIALLERLGQLLVDDELEPVQSEDSDN